MPSVGWRLAFWAALAAVSSLSPAARAHFLWLRFAEGDAPNRASIRAFFNEEPEPDSNFNKYVRDVRLVVDGQVVPSQLEPEARQAVWVGRRPAAVDSELDLGVVNRQGKAFRLRYAARAQTAPVAAETPETATRLRVRLLQSEGNSRDQVQVLFDGKPVPGARIRVYPAEGEPLTLTADAQGRGTIPGISEGKAALWATRTDPTPGEHDGKRFTETRDYATLTFTPEKRSEDGAAPPTAFATMPAPAVTSLGAAVLGDWLYVYGGHVGKVHRYNAETTSRHFRRLNLKDRTTWEDLPMGPDLQGVSLVSDGRFLYRIGGMAARNAPDDDQDMHSVAAVARFDPEKKTWTDLPSMPEPRSTHDAAVVGRTLFVVGGWNMKGTSEESTFLDHALTLDLDQPAAGWKTLSQPFRRRALAAAAHGGKLYVLGGLGEGGMKVERRVDIFDPERNAWSRGPDIPAVVRTEGFGSSAFEQDGRLYVSGASGRIHRLNEVGDGWEVVGAWSVPRITHRLLPGPDHGLLAVGGAAKGQPTPWIEAVRLGPVGAPASRVTVGRRP